LADAPASDCGEGLDAAAGDAPGLEALAGFSGAAVDAEAGFGGDVGPAGVAGPHADSSRPQTMKNGHLPDRLMPLTTPPTLQPAESRWLSYGRQQILESPRLIKLGGTGVSSVHSCRAGLTGQARRTSHRLPSLVDRETAVEPDEQVALNEQSIGGIVVTGASSGIGAATACSLAARGYTVGCLSRRGTVPETVSGHALGFKCDVTDPEQITAAVDAFAGHIDSIVGLVNNAGAHQESPSAELPLDTLRHVLETNFVSAFSVCQQVYPHLKTHGGLIVNIGSFYDHLGVRSNLAYSASKAAIASMTRTLAVEWARDNIQVVNVAPGYILTELNREWFSDPKNHDAVVRRIPARQIGQPEDVARLIAGLFESRSAFLTGTTVYIDGGEGISL
jgi:NAD(P)-dependent dehydrogenase (short-subunit alcohol dehydrogenase family)